MTRNRRSIIAAGVGLFLSLLAVSCSKPAESNFVIPKPTPGNTGNTGNNGNNGNSGNNGNNNNGNNGDNGGNTEVRTLCTDIGQTPIVLAYFTEYTERSALMQ